MTFANKIKRCREKAGLSQQQLADAVGISKRAVASYESEGSKARPDTIEKLAEALNVSVDYLTIDIIDDPLYGREKAPYLDVIIKEFGSKAAKDLNKLLEKNVAFFAGGSMPQEAKDAFFEALTEAYLNNKREAKKKFGRKS